MAFGRRQAFIGSGNGLNDGTGGAGMAAFAGNAATCPECCRHRPNVTRITRGKSYFLRTVGMIGRVDGVTGFT